MYSEAIKQGLKSGEVLSGEEVSERGLSDLWGDGGLQMVIDRRKPVGRMVSYRVMTEDEFKRYLEKCRNTKAVYRGP